MNLPQSDHPDIDFMSLVSHQLSTPLAAVRWYAELLHKGSMTKPLDETQAQFVEEILDGAARMGELVGDLSNASRLDRNKYTDDPVATDFASIIKDDREQLQTEISTKHLSVTLELESGLPKLMGRPSLLHMIAQNLLTNAIKYTPEKGSINLELRRATPEEHKHLPHAAKAALMLVCTDTGYGIPKAQQAHIYQKFFRADNVRALGLFGSGLGLYITATAANKLGGASWFDSVENKGSSFYVILPLPKA